jgi:hypothetical protein
VAALVENEKRGIPENYVENKMGVLGSVHTLGGKLTN